MLSLVTHADEPGAGLTPFCVWECMTSILKEWLLYDSTTDHPATRAHAKLT